MISKITRTIIGLPIILFAWPFVLIGAVFFTTIVHVLVSLKWVFTGEIDSSYSPDDMENSRIFFVKQLTFGYRFLKEVWNDKN